MPNVDIHWLAVIVAAAINMAIGSVWYSKNGFGKEWSKLTGKKMEEMGGAGMGYAFMAVVSLVQAWVLAHFVTYASAGTFVKGAVVGFWLWLAFTGLTMAVNLMFEKGAAWGLLKINGGYWLLVFLINGGLLAVWR